MLEKRDAGDAGHPDLSPKDWADGLAGDFHRLVGETVVGWHGVEWAIRSSYDDDPAQIHFQDPDVPCLQLRHMSALLASGEQKWFGVFMGAEDYGLWVRDRDVMAQGPFHGLARARELVELPVGPVTEVTVLRQIGVIDEVVLHIGHSRLLLIAGEVSDIYGLDLVWTRFDESLLVFTDPELADGLPWSTPRLPLRERLRPPTGERRISR